MAGEPETLATDEPLAERIRRHDYDRLLMLSDGVFSIAITLLALELPFPSGWDGRLDTLPQFVGGPLVAYGFGFLIVGAFWTMHRRIFARLLRVDLICTLLSLLMLGVVGLAPFVARVLAELGPSRSMTLYVAMVAIVMAIQSTLWGYAMSRNELVHADLPANRRWELLVTLASVAVLWGALAIWATVTDRRLGSTPLFLGALASVVAKKTAARLLNR
jgi:uncharacterized membrane protein